METDKPILHMNRLPNNERGLRVGTNRLKWVYEILI
jgi:hypothetical protein